MSFQGYLETIKEKTGKTPEDFVALAKQKGLLKPDVKPAQIIAWLNADYGLGRGHAMAIVSILKQHTQPKTTSSEKVERHFTGKKAQWRPAYDALIGKVEAFGDDTDVLAGATYLSLRKSGKKFAIVQITGDRLDVGIKLKNAPPSGRLETAGSWNSMVTHRVRIHKPSEVDKQLIGWLKQAYEAA